MTGCVHIYHGNGKGKTSAALGLAIRAAGRGHKVLLARFLKNDDSGELPVLRAIPGITVMPCERSFGFVFQMTAARRQEAAAFYHDYFLAAIRQAREGDYDVLILDEIVAACTYEMVTETEILAFLKEKPAGLEVVITGRNPSAALLQTADYVTEMKLVRHPFEKGMPAREGIEY